MVKAMCVCRMQPAWRLSRKLWKRLKEYMEEHAESIETRGIVLYNREFREDDKLVKIFTEKSGKRMFCETCGEGRNENAW